MSLQVDAMYENRVLRPLQPLDLREREHVLVSVVKAEAQGRSNLAVEYIESVKNRTPNRLRVLRKFAGGLPRLILAFANKSVNALHDPRGWLGGMNRRSCVDANQPDASHGLKHITRPLLSAA
jgi:predicted DNA-binding antitoxin AbrB/MazE fold protein